MSYFKSNGIIALKKHVDVNHGSIAKKSWRRSELQHEKSNGKITLKGKACNKQECISNFFGVVIKKDYVH